MANNRPIMPEDRSKRTNTQLVQNINRSIRTDWGGKDPMAVVPTKFAKWLEKHTTNVEVPALSSVQILFIVDLCKEQIEGCRARTAADRDELMARFTKYQGEDQVKTLEDRVITLEGIVEKMQNPAIQTEQLPKSPPLSHQEQASYLLKLYGERKFDLTDWEKDFLGNVATYRSPSIRQRLKVEDIWFEKM